MKPGQDAKVDYVYIRHGVVNIFMASEPLKDKRYVIGKFKNTQLAIIQADRKFINNDI
jgi:hypothetical protein